MSASPNLAIPHVVSNQNNKEVTINEAVDALDRAFNDTIDIGFFFGGTPAASQTVKFIATRAFTLPADLAGSQGHAGTAATAQADFDVRKNGGSIGTASFAASASTATFVFASATSFAAGDRLEVTAPASPDATLADVAITLTGTRS